MTKKVKNISQPSILIVDDERELRNLFNKALTKEGYNVLIAENGKEAINVVKRNEPDLALLDIRMPGIGGIDVLRRLKAIKPNLAVIILTGYGTIESAKKAMLFGAYDYITKPFNLGYLKAVIKDALKSACRGGVTPPLHLKEGFGMLKKRHCQGTAPCMWEVAVRAFGFGDDECALGWMKDPDIPARDKTALVQLSRALVSKMKSINKEP